MRHLIAALALLFVAGCDSSEPEPAGTSRGIAVSLYPVSASDFTGSGSVQTATYPVAALTQRVHDYGLVMGALDLNGESGAWYQLPLTLPTSTTTLAIGSAHQVGRFSLTLTASSPGSYGSLLAGQTLRVVTIEPDAPGIEQARAALQAGDGAQAAKSLGID